MAKSSASSLVNYRTTTKRIEFSSILSGLIGTIAVWLGRRHQRHALAQLDDHLLADVGLSPEQAGREAAKPFWKR